MQSGMGDRVSFSAWLKGFLSQRRLEAPDQRALHAYHCTQEEYARLRQLLGATVQRQPIVGDLTASACFVLFGAEWYRREYCSQDRWSWGPIFVALGRTLSQQQLAEVIPAGLERYWKRPLHFYESSRRDFLGSVFGEGGLPSLPLRDEGSRFQALFDRVLRQYDEARLLGLSTVDLVRRLLDRVNLPQVFTTVDSTALIAEMADRLVELVQDYALDRAADPVARVNDLNPKWREQFPLPLDDATGSQLLTGLLQTATDEGTKRRKRVDAWKCVHFWDEREPSVLTTRITLPNQVELDLRDRPATTRFDLALVEDGQPIARLGAGYGEIIGDGHRVRIKVRCTEAVVKRQHPSAALSFVLLAGGSVAALALVPASAVALDEAPVSFEPSSDRWQLCGQASCRAAGTEVLIALPSNGGPVPTEPQEGVEVADGPSICGLRALRVCGKGEVRILGSESTGSVYRIRTGCARQVESSLELAGNSIGWPTQPELAFVGVPKPQLVGGGEAFEREEVALYIGGRPVGDGLPHSVLGTQFASLRNSDGDVLLRRKIAVLPPDFRIDLEGGDAPTRGFINVRTGTRCLVQVTTPGVRARQSRQDGVVRLALEVATAPPATISVAVTPNLEADPIYFDLPFPSSGCLAFDQDGKPLASELCVDDLPGSRLRLFGAVRNVAVFTLELAIRGIAARSAFYRWSYMVRNDPISIELFSLRDEILSLLSLWPDVDQSVELHVWDSRSRHEARFRIGRYASHLRYDETRERLIVEREAVAPGGAPEPCLMLLHDPRREALDLQPCTSEGVPTGGFVVPQRTSADGPWLVLPRPRSAVSFRPFYIAGATPTELLDGQVHSLEKASAQFDPNAQESAFVPVLAEMATNPNHSGWSFLGSLYESYGYLPLSTFKVWEALALKVPQALAASLFKFDADPQFVAKIEREFPILWELFPLPALRTATHVFRSFLRDSGMGTDGDVRAVTARMLERLASSIEAYDVTVRAFLLEETVVDRLADIPRDVILTPWYQDLLRDCGESEWPTFEGERLERWASENMAMSLPFSVQAEHRKAVVYLPIFAAAVAAGRAEMADLFHANADTVFRLRKLRDFDPKWFNSMYRYCLSQELAAHPN